MNPTTTESMKCADCNSQQDTLIPFITPDNATKLLCMLCYGQSLKGRIVECECCPSIVAERSIKIYGGNMKMCISCFNKEIQAQIELVKTENQQARITTMHDALERAKAIDSAVSVRTDLFNAATVSIVDLKAIIDNDETVNNKNFKLAETLMERFEHFRSVVFEANATIVNATNNQKAIQVYLNQLSNQLRAEERAKLKIQDINYKPKEVKPVKPRAITTARKKLDKVALRQYASELGVSEFTLQMIVVSKGITVEKAADILRKNLRESISESKPVEDNLPAVEMTQDDLITDME